ncbi:DUF602-domain-containing protein [Lentithecium fluviatile CBS 122367]|uniref:DUF602-domain-containing protein n=1 Tax=Lentithecium fluviatile CBS 122367 TaxID=1168545 RepID=A0A6G1JA26_9PLEO|nr:DUF602-domain-containing protein [Lentithecium fluviatile CBS 122367]
MGNDGGSIPTRRELVKEAAKALTTTQIKEVQQESQEHAWNHDPLSSKPLSSPVVSDSAGVLYNKDSIIEFLLAEEKDAEQEKVLDGRVKGLKDVVEVKFEVDSGGEDKAGTGARREKWVCPITREEMGPQAKAVYLVPCGHAFAGSVVREVQERICVQCNKPYAENDIITILPTAPTDIARLNLRVKTLKEKGLTHALKKAPGSKKRKKHADAENADAPDAKASTSEEDKKKEKKEKKASKTDNGIKNASTAYLTKRVLEEQQERNKKRKLEQNDNVKSLFSKGGVKPAVGNSADYMTRGYSLGKK